MKTIIKQGKPIILEIKRFECWKCGCVYDCDEYNEFFEYAVNGYDAYIKSECPNCENDIAIHLRSVMNKSFVMRKISKI